MTPPSEKILKARSVPNSDAPKVFATPKEKEIFISQSGPLLRHNNDQVLQSKTNMENEAYATIFKLGTDTLMTLLEPDHSQLMPTPESVFACLELVAHDSLMLFAHGLSAVSTLAQAVSQLDQDIREQVARNVELSWTDPIMDHLASQASELDAQLCNGTLSLQDESKFAGLGRQLLVASGAMIPRLEDINYEDWSRFNPTCVTSQLYEIVARLETTYHHFQRSVYLDGQVEEELKLWYLIWTHLKDALNDGPSKRAHGFNNEFFADAEMQATMSWVASQPSFFYPRQVEYLVGEYCSFLGQFFRYDGPGSRAAKLLNSCEPLSQDEIHMLSFVPNDLVPDSQRRVLLYRAVLRLNHLAGGPATLRLLGGKATWSPVSDKSAVRNVVEPADKFVDSVSVAAMPSVSGSSIASDRAFHPRPELSSSMDAIYGSSPSQGSPMKSPLARLNATVNASIAEAEILESQSPGGTSGSEMNDENMGSGSDSSTAATSIWSPSVGRDPYLDAFERYMRRGRNILSARDYVYCPVPENRSYEVANSRLITRDLRDPGYHSDGLRTEDIVNLPLPHCRTPGTWTMWKRRIPLGPYEIFNLLGATVADKILGRRKLSKQQPLLPPRITPRRPCRHRRSRSKHGVQNYRRIGAVKPTPTQPIGLRGGGPRYVPNPSESPTRQAPGSRIHKQMVRKIQGSDLITDNQGAQTASASRHIRTSNDGSTPAGVAIIDLVSDDDAGDGQGDRVKTIESHGVITPAGAAAIKLVSEDDSEDKRGDSNKENESYDGNQGESAAQIENQTQGEVPPPSSPARDDDEAEGVEGEQLNHDEQNVNITANAPKFELLGASRPRCHPCPWYEDQWHHVCEVNCAGFFFRVNTHPQQTNPAWFKGSLWLFVDEGLHRLPEASSLKDIVLKYGYDFSGHTDAEFLVSNGTVVSAQRPRTQDDLVFTLKNGPTDLCAPNRTSWSQRADPSEKYLDEIGGLRRFRGRATRLHVRTPYQADYRLMLENRKVLRIMPEDRLIHPKRPTGTFYKLDIENSVKPLILRLDRCGEKWGKRGDKELYERLSVVQGCGDEEEQVTGEERQQVTANDGDPPAQLPLSKASGTGHPRDYNAADTSGMTEAEQNIVPGFSALRKAQEELKKSKEAHAASVAISAAVALPTASTSTGPAAIAASNVVAVGVTVPLPVLLPAGSQVTIAPMMLPQILPALQSPGSGAWRRGQPPQAGAGPGVSTQNSRVPASIQAQDTQTTQSPEPVMTQTVAAEAVPVQTVSTQTSGQLPASASEGADEGNAGQVGDVSQNTSPANAQTIEKGEDDQDSESAKEVERGAKTIRNSKKVVKREDDDDTGSTGIAASATTTVRMTRSSTRAATLASQNNAGKGKGKATTKKATGKGKGKGKRPAEDDSDDSSSPGNEDVSATPAGKRLKSGSLKTRGPKV